MCDTNVYISRSVREELFMSSVDRIDLGEDDSIFEIYHEGVG